MRFIWKIVVLLFGFVFSYRFVDAKVRVNDTTGGYTGLVIALDAATVNRVNPKDVQVLIYNLKELLTRASATLNRATQGRLFFQDVTILLPSDVNIVGFNSMQIDPAEAGEVYGLADVRVTTRRQGIKYAITDFFPKTIRRGDCGEHGDFIHLTSGYLFQASNITFVKRYGDPAKEFVNQWSKYRFGLFDENDPSRFYFHPVRGVYETAYCANVKINGSILNSVTRLPCSVNNSSQFPSKNCRFFHGNLNNDHAVTSLLFDAKLPHVVNFCDETTHNPYAPTMQNLRCQGRSAWEVMMKHSDFSSADSMELQFMNSTPEFRFVHSIGNANIVVVIDYNIFSGNSSVSDAVLSSLRKYILFGMPDGTTIEVLFVNSTSRTIPLIMSIENTFNREYLLEAIDFILYNDSSSFIVHDELIEAELLKWKNGVVLFIVATETLDGNWSNRLEGAHFAPVFVNKTPDSKLVQIADDNDGNVYAIHGGLYDLEADLDSIFLDASNRFTDAFDIVQITSGVMNTSGGTYPDIFIVDKAVVKYLRIIVSVISQSAPSHLTQEFLAKEAVTIVSPTVIYGRESARLIAVEESIKTKSYIMFNLPDAQPGVWSLRIGPGFVPESTIVVYQVYAVPPNRNSLRSLPAFMANAHLDRKTVEGHQVPRLTVRLTKSDGIYSHGIVANVSARIYPPHSKDSFLKILKDTGTGADVIAGDGVYSAFLTNFTSEGVYRVVPFVFSGDGLSCLIGKSSDCFQRTISPLYFEVKNMTADDLFPPSTIKDLILVDSIYDEFSEGQTIVTLNWTSPGDNYDDGFASGHDLRYFTDWLATRNFTFGVKITNRMLVRGDLLTTTPAGNVQSFSVRFPKTLNNGSALFLGIRAYDLAGNFGDPSNIVVVPGSPIEQLSTTTIPSNVNTTTSPIYNVTINVTVISSTNSPPSMTPILPETPGSSIKNSHAHDGVIASIILLVIAIIITIVICVHMKFFSKKSKPNNFSYEEFQVGERVASRIEH